MRWHGFRVDLVVLFLCLGLGLLFGGRWVYNTLQYANPLESFLQDNVLIQSYQIEKEKEQTDISVDLGKVDNIAQSYADLYQALEQVMGKKEFTLTITDQRNGELEELLHHSEFAIYEAMVRGNYREMEQAIISQAVDKGVLAKVFMNPQAVYVQLEKDEHYLYAKIPADLPQQGIQGVTRG